MITRRDGARSQTGFGWVLLAVLVVASALLAQKAVGADGDFRIANVEYESASRTLRVLVATSVQDYFVLYQGPHVGAITNPVAIALGTGAELTLGESRSTPAGTSFYRVARFLREAPGDLDEDGMNDVDELLAGPDQDPLTPDVRLAPVIINANTRLTCADPSIDGRDLVVNNATLTVDCNLRLNSLTITNGGVLTCSDNRVEGLRLWVRRNLLLQGLGSAIDVTGRGYAPGEGPGAGEAHASYGGGASHGGEGTANYNDTATWGATYGSFEAPALAGSGGGQVNGGGGSGGGFLDLEVQGVLELRASIKADGEPAVSGGAGSGGSIRIRTGTLRGGGVVSARGGSENGNYAHGAGGGGRIAIYFRTNEFTGSADACGGLRVHSGNRYAGAGTVWWEREGEGLGTLHISNCNNDTTQITTVNGELAVRGDVRVGRFGKIGPSKRSTGMHLRVSRHLLVERDGFIWADFRGFEGGEGPGAGESGTNQGGGASHGGEGTENHDNTAGWGQTYGSFETPSLQGSGGGQVNRRGGGAGGGVVRLTVGGELEVAGRITANGDVPRSGGAGAGGSVWISAQTIRGGGLISAIGGSEDGNTAHGAGGGGRIALYFATNDFTGRIEACGGLRVHSGNIYAGAGTIWTEKLGLGVGTLEIQNCDHETRQITTFSGEVSVRGDVRVNRSGRLGPVAGQTNLHLKVSRDVTVDQRGAFWAIGRGHEVGAGPGAGQLADYPAGASHGGEGTPNYTSSAFAGPTYGSIQTPLALGSGGGGRPQARSPGGRGGGSLRLTVGNTLAVLGEIRADGEAARAGRGGGGAGGSLWIMAKAIEGTGSVTASGGSEDGNSAYGAGGGGRIALYFETNQFSGDLAACGGRRAHSGPVFAGAGTIWLKPSATEFGELIIRNCRNAGGPTGMDDAPIVASRLIITDGAKLAARRAGTPLRLEVQGDLVIPEGGFMDVSGLGYAAGTGPGVGSTAPGSRYASGGGFGGSGGDSGDGSEGGLSYGSEIEPADFGSGGALAALGGVGAPGGGMIRIIVRGEMRMDGIMLANGFHSRNGGAGSGGSIWITADRFSGRGLIQAIGGTGSGGDGSGGGGRVAIHSRCNPEVARMRIEVQGGSGAEPGTVYFGALTSTNVVVRSLRVNPRNTYLRVSNDPEAGPAEAIDLSSLSLRSGDTVRLRRLGSFRYDPPSPNLLNTMAGIFSTNSLLRAPSLNQRVVGAVATGKPYFTLPTLEGVFPTDIPEDFEISDTLVCIPSGARFLFISANDFFFGDNSDEDGDYQLEITKYVYEPTQ